MTTNIFNCTISKYYFLTFLLFDKINAPMVSIKLKKNLTNPNILNSSICPNLLVKTFYIIENIQGLSAPAARVTFHMHHTFLAYRCVVIHHTRE